MIALGTEVPELLPEHADGTLWSDIEGDVWTPMGALGWMVSYRSPFEIVNQPAHPGPLYGPYRAVVTPP